MPTYTPAVRGMGRWDASCTPLARLLNSEDGKGLCDQEDSAPEARERSKSGSYGCPIRYSNASYDCSWRLLERLVVDEIEELSAKRIGLR